MQYALIKLIESERHSFDQKGYNEAFLMKLSKEFDTLNHNLLIAKLYACG